MKQSSNFQLPTSNYNNPRVVIVHDWIYGGGAEKVVEQLHILYPNAPIYTSYCTDEWRKRLDNKVVTGYLQNWPFSGARKFLPLLRQWWFARLDLSNFDLIISSTGNGEAKFARASPKAAHICYCHSPPHFYWRKYKAYLANPGFGSFNGLARFGLRLLVRPLRERDFRAAQKVDYFLANSSHIQNDIKTFYGRDSIVIHPPVATSEFNKPESQNPSNGVAVGGVPQNLFLFKEKILGADRLTGPRPILGFETQVNKVIKTNDSKSDPIFIYCGRHVPDKRIDLAVEACNQLSLNLIIIGNGPETENLKKLAGPTIAFTGRISDVKLHELAATASAFIFPSEDDFGIAPVEALASGTPVIAYKAGGALDYVIEDKTGLFFEEQTVESLVKALKAFDPEKFDETEIKQYAKRFSDTEFRTSITDFLKKIEDL